MKKRVINRLKNLPPENSDREYRFKICLWLALGKTTCQIVDLVKDRYNVDMSPQNIDKTYRYGKKWKPIINYLCTRYLKNISRIPIANKHYRLAMLQEALEEALTWHTKSINEYGEIQEKKIGTIPQIINEAREEVEPSHKGINITDNRPIIINFHANGQPESDSNRHLLSTTQATALPRG